MSDSHDDYIAEIMAAAEYTPFSFSPILDDEHIAEESLVLVRKVVSNLNVGGLRGEVYHMARSIYSDPNLLNQATVQALKHKIMVQEEVGRMAVLHVVGVEAAIEGAVSARYTTNTSSARLEALEKQALRAAEAEAKKGPVKNPMRPLRP